jgi:Putative lumazine-binding
MNYGTDGEEIRDLSERYYAAMVAGDRDTLGKLFEARAAIVGNYDGAFLWLDLEAFIAETESLVGQHGAEECGVESLRVDGDIATVAVRGRYAGVWLVDHLSAVRVGTGWRIVGKTFHVQDMPVEHPDSQGRS